MLRFSPIVLSVVFASTLFLSTSAIGRDERAEKQADLDRACESAREQRLAPMRAQFVKECVKEKQFETRKECEAYYADFGGRAGTRAPLFYDLPACVKAFDYAQSARSGG
jgi:hypothetical protein